MTECLNPSRAMLGTQYHPHRTAVGDWRGEIQAPDSIKAILSGWNPGALSVDSLAEQGFGHGQLRRRTNGTG